MICLSTFCTHSSISSLSSYFTSLRFVGMRFLNKNVLMAYFTQYISTILNRSSRNSLQVVFPSAIAPVVTIDAMSMYRCGTLTSYSCGNIQINTSGQNNSTCENQKCYQYTGMHSFCFRFRITRFVIIIPTFDQVNQSGRTCSLCDNLQLQYHHNVMGAFVFHPDKLHWLTILCQSVMVGPTFHFYNCKCL